MAIFSIHQESKAIKLGIVIIICIFMLLCTASFIYHWDDYILGDPNKFDNDDVKYLRSAQTLIETGRYTYKFPDQDTVFIMPGLTTLLAGFMLVFKNNPLIAFRIFQMLLGVASLYAVFLCGRRLFNAKIGLATMGIMAVYPPSIYVTGAILTEASFYFLFVMTFLMTIYAVQLKKMKYYIYGGIFLGLSALFRPTILMFPLVVLALWLIKRYKLSEMLKFGGAVIGVVIIILSPWIIRNALLFGEFIPLTKASGNPAMQGTFINYDQSVREIENIDYHNIIKDQTDIDIDKFNKDELVTNAVELEMTKIRLREVVLKEPLKYLYWYTLGKTIENWKAPFLWVSLFGISHDTAIIWHLIIIFVGVAGFLCFLVQESEKGLMWIPAFSIAYFNCIHLPFYCFSRYMFPVMFCVALFAAYVLFNNEKRAPQY